MWLCPWLSEGPFRSTSALWGASGAFSSSQEVPFSPPHIASLPPADAALLGASGRSGPLSPRTAVRAPSLRRGGAGTRIEMPWWLYSSRGMHLLFPSTLARLPAGASALSARGGAAGAPHMHLDQELQFDREVFPIGVSLADAAIIGMSQRLHRASYSAPRPHPRARKVRPASPTMRSLDTPDHSSQPSTVQKASHTSPPPCVWTGGYQLAHPVPCRSLLLLTQCSHALQARVRRRRGPSHSRVAEACNVPAVG